MNPQKRIINAISEIGKSRVGLSAYERQLETASTAWLEQLSERISGETDELSINDTIVELSSIVESLLRVSGTPYVNMLTGKALSLLVKAERQIPRSRKIMKRLLSQRTADLADTDKKRLLLINPGWMSTKVSYFEGIEKIHETEIHVSPDIPDGVNSRVDSIVSWLKEANIKISSLDGISSRCGFLHPIPSGTYRIVPEMLQDMEHPRIEHASNMSPAITL